MKKLFLCAALGLGMALMSGCEVGEEDDTDLQFVNASHRTVQVIPLSIEWSAFTLQPGEKKVVKDVTNLDFRLRPDGGVQEGQASTDRRVIIVDRPKTAAP